METREEIERRMQRIRDGEIVDVIRVRTAMYTGERTLSAVHQFLNGFGFASHVHQIPYSNLPLDFHDWVAYRLHFIESTSGYRRMILDRVPDEGQALDRFFELVDEHRARQATVVAKVRCHPENHDVFKHVDGDLKNQIRVRVAKEIQIVAYTDDPGFFLMHDDQTAEHPRRTCFCPALSWIRHPFKPDAEYLTILDHGRYERFLREDEEFRQRRKEEAKQRERQVESE